MNLVSVIIPFLNEEENIPSLVKAINEFSAAASETNYEFIFVDDGSTDNSLEVLQQQSFMSCSSKVVKLSRNFGSHAALRAGISTAKGQFITFLYADLQDPIDLIYQMQEQCLKGMDIVWAFRSQTNSAFGERIFSKIYASLMRKFALANFPSNGFDVVMFSSKVQQSLNQNIESNSSIFLQLLQLGFRQNSISYEKKTRRFGKSKWTLRKKVKLFVDSFVAFSFAPIRSVTIIGILLFIIGGLFSCYLIFRRLLYNDLVQGWAMLISILLIGFGITNISLGIIAEYLWRTLDAARNRPVFIIDHIVELSEKNKHA